jgi:hypothetical protein
MKNAEWERLGGWVAETSKYLEEVLPQLDYLMIDFIDRGEEDSRIRIIFASGNTRFIRGVVLPGVERLMQHALQRSGTVRRVKQDTTLEYKIRGKEVWRLMGRLFHGDMNPVRNRRRMFMYTGSNWLYTAEELRLRQEYEGGP